MDLVKSYDFFKPEMLRERVHIIGLGAMGSTVAENLARFGITRISLYDFDVVEAKNIANQMFTSSQIGTAKVDAVADIIRRINPDSALDLKLYPKGYTGQKLSGHIFLCVDDIDLRREIAESNANNPFIRGMYDFRMGLTDAQHYAADWRDVKSVQNFIGTMQFTHDEAKANVPVSACNQVLSVCPTVRMIAAAGVANFINFVKGEGIRKMILIDAFKFTIDAF